MGQPAMFASHMTVTERLLIKSSGQRDHYLGKYVVPASFRWSSFNKKSDWGPLMAPAELVDMVDCISKQILF